MADSIESYEILLVGTRETYEHDYSLKCLVSNAITLLPITHTLEGISAFIFTSRYGIASLIESASPTSPFYNPHLAHWRDIPSFVISPASAKELQKHKANIAFIGQSAHGGDFAREIIPLLKDHTPLYLRAKEIISKLDSILKSAQIPLQEFIAYTNTPQNLPQNLKPKPKSILIFTAPSAYKSFISNFAWEQEYIALAIGKSTFAHFSPHINAHIAPKPNIESALTLARALAQNLAPKH